MLKLPALAGAAAALLALAGTFAAAGAARAAQPVFEETPCVGDFSGDPHAVTCGYLSVDESRGAWRSRRVVLPVAVVHALAPRPGAPPVVYLHGGPGANVIPGLPRLLRSAMGRDLIAQDQDWIFFDQRGTSLAMPSLDCGDAALTDDGPLSQGALDGLFACGRRESASGVDLSRYDSAETARDVQDLRRALRLGDIELYGVSYGTRVEFSVLKDAPEGVRAAVLDSVWPADAGWAVGGPQMVSAAVRKLLTRCVATPACAGAFPNVMAEADLLSRRFLAGPVAWKGRLYTPDDLGNFFMDAAYDADGARALPRDVHRMYGGDLTALREDVDTRSEYAEGDHLAVLCKERFPFEDANAVSADPHDPVASLTVASFRRYFQACRAFDVGRPDPSEGRPVSSATPALFLSAEFDPGCPPELAAAAVRLFPHGQAVTLPDTTHGVARLSPCARRMARAFLLDPTAPVDRSCVGEAPGFAFTLG